jgi:hypothetical protein
MPGQELDPKQKVFFKYKQQIEEEKRLFSLQNGTLSNLDVDPVILKEIIYPLEVPTERGVMLLEACFYAYNQGRIVFALKNLDLAQEECTSNGMDFTGANAIFFFFMKGSIYESGCRDDLAMASYFKCHTENQK